MSELTLEYSPQNDWLPLMDYAVQKGVSLSTLRRYIKAQKIEYKLEKGRYFIRNSEIKTQEGIPASAEFAALQDKTQLLETELHKAYEEISELKMLIALYENKIPHSAPSLDQ